MTCSMLPQTPDELPTGAPPRSRRSRPAAGSRTSRSRTAPMRTADSLMRVERAISEPVQVGRVDLPPAETTISVATRIEEAHDQADT